MTSDLQHDVRHASCRCGTPTTAPTAHPLSTHRTSIGTVVYDRCDCGRPLFRIVP